MIEEEKVTKPKKLAKDEVTKEWEDLNEAEKPFKGRVFKDLSLGDSYIFESKGKKKEAKLFNVEEQNNTLIVQEIVTDVEVIE